MGAEGRYLMHGQGTTGRGMDTMNHLRTLIERREYVVDADKVASAILSRLLVDAQPSRDAE
jgi:anti-sigma28 factor (negative regulator of flagellin synthesis)